MRRYKKKKKESRSKTATKLPSDRLGNPIIIRSRGITLVCEGVLRCRCDAGCWQGDDGYQRVENGRRGETGEGKGGSVWVYVMKGV